MTEKPKPLDLRDMKKKIIEKTFEVEGVIEWRIQPKGEWDENVIKEIVRRDVKIFSHVDYAVELRDVEELLEEIKHRIRKACEFYLRYKDKPELLIKEHPEYSSDVVRICGFKPNSQELNPNEKYNEWLFKLAFRGVLDDRQN